MSRHPDERWPYCLPPRQRLIPEGGWLVIGLAIVVGFVLLILFASGLI